MEFGAILNSTLQVIENEAIRKFFSKSRKFFLRITKKAVSLRSNSPLKLNDMTGKTDKTFPPLYKRDATGGVRQWRVIVEGDTYWTEYGLMDGAITTSPAVKAMPKNVGRSNESTAERQAVLEAASMWRRAKEQNGYWENIADIDKKLYMPPMLANTYDGNYKPSMQFEQPKLDGIRCNISRVDNDTIEALSRKGKPFHTVGHILDELQDVLPFGVHIDGELYNHTLYDDFNQIVSLVKKQKPTAEDLEKARSLVQYHIYDLWIDQQPNASFKDRMELAQMLFDGMDSIKIVETKSVSDHKAIRTYYEYFTGLGYEGAIIRNNNPYQHNRCNNLLKYKEFKTDEFIVADICEGRVGGQAEYAVITLHDGQTCKATIAATDEVCTKMLQDADRLIGSMATVKFFGYTPAGKLRFPVLLSFRDYE